MTNVATPPAPPPPAPPPAVAYAPAPPARPRLGGRLLLAGLALALALVAGAAGFALGQVTADEGRDGPGRVFHRGPDGQFGGPFGGPGQGQRRDPAQPPVS